MIERKRITIHDPLLDKTFITEYEDKEGGEEYARKRLEKQIEHERFKLLPLEEQATIRHPDDFKCPYCMTRETPSKSRKEKITHLHEVHALFFSSRKADDKLVDIFTCTSCNREFTHEERREKQKEQRYYQWQHIKTRVEKGGTDGK